MSTQDYYAAKRVRREAERKKNSIYLGILSLADVYYDGNTSNWPLQAKYATRGKVEDIAPGQLREINKIDDFRDFYLDNSDYTEPKDSEKVRTNQGFVSVYRYNYDRYFIADHKSINFRELAPLPLPALPNLSELWKEVERFDKWQKFEIEAMTEAISTYRLKHENWTKLYKTKVGAWRELVKKINQDQISVDSYQQFYSYALDRHPLPVDFKNTPEVQYSESNSTLIVETKIPDQSEIQWPVGAYKNNSLKFASKLVHKKILDENFYGLIIRTGIIASSYQHQLPFKSVVINVRQEWFDPATGVAKTGIVASVQGPTEFFSSLNPCKLDPKACFTKLRGLSTRSLKELAPIKPIMEFDKSDKRFVGRQDIPLEELQNIAAIPWEDFEHLVANIIEKEFEKDGMEVKVTRTSREGGVDAVLFDPNPIMGGKYILQAKRYTNTVNPSAVRDLAATVVKEGANRGILITTSSFGPDSYEFIKNLPITLIDGNGLLGIFEKHGDRYKIDLEEAKLLNAIDDQTRP